jgi:hypothetical protein
MSGRPSQRPSVAPPADEAERRRQLPVSVVLAVYRLVKACQLYDDANQTVRQLVPPVPDAVSSFCRLLGTDRVRLLFSPEVVMVNRKMLRAPRDTFALALQVGALLETAGVNELVLEQGLSPASAGRLARLLADAQHDAAAAARLREERIPGATVRRAPGPEAELDFDPHESPITRTVKAYAASVLVLQGCYARLGRGEPVEIRQVKRVAQRLVALGDEHAELLTALAAGPLIDADPARRAVSTAVVADAMIHLLTDERELRSTVAQAALVADADLARGAAPTAGPARAARALPALAALGQYYFGALRRNVVALETLGLSAPAGPLPDGATSPTTAAAVLFVARRFNELRTPDARGRAASIDEVVRTLEADARGPLEQALLRLLVVALGFYPLRTVVELDSGEIAVVSGFPKSPLDFSRPPVQVLLDAGQTMLPTPLAVDLAAPTPGQPARRIRRIGRTV